MEFKSNVAIMRIANYNPLGINLTSSLFFNGHELSRAFGGRNNSPMSSNQAPKKMVLSLIDCMLAGFE